MRTSTAFIHVPALLFFSASLFANNSTRVGSFGQIPLTFEENVGQADSDVKFVAHATGYTVTLGPKQARLSGKAARSIDLTLVGADPHSSIAGVNRLPVQTNYYVGTPDQWKIGVPSYESVRYSDVYPGIDLVFHAEQRQLEYDFVLRPNADPNRIEFAFNGVDRIDVDASGNLNLRINSQTIIQKRPVLYQEYAGTRHRVSGRYELTARNTVRFRVSDYNPQRSLVIDPVISYSTFWGSVNNEIGKSIAVDKTGFAYIAGTTTGDVSLGFVSKLNPAGTAGVYNSYFGDGSCNASANGVAVDAAGYAYVTGLYGAKDQWGYCNNKYVLGAKIDSTGAKVYYYYYGGGDDYGNAIAVDSAGNAYMTGKTNGNFPVTNGSQGGFPGDAFILEVNSTGKVLYATYLGGGLIDEGLAIAVDQAGMIYLAGTTSSADFPTTSSAYERQGPAGTQTAFVSKVNPANSTLVYSTYLGGFTGEEATGIAVDSKGLIYVVGDTESEDFPTTANAYDRTCGTDGHCNPAYSGSEVVNAEDAFLAQINPSLSGVDSLLYSTYFGATGHDYGQAIALDATGHAYIAGMTASNNLPKVSPTQGTYAENTDAFVAEFDLTKSGAAGLLFSTYIGGNGYDEADGIAVDSNSNVYVTGKTSSTAFPVVNPLQATNAGSYDTFVTKIEMAPELALASVSVNPSSVTGGVASEGTVKLAKAATGAGSTVTLMSTNSDAVVPVTVTVPAGSSSANFKITTTAVTASRTVSIEATLGSVTKSAALTITSQSGLASVTVSAATITGGNTVTGTITLSGAAPAGGEAVALISSNPTVAPVPGSVTVPAGAAGVTFSIATKAVSVASTVTITASHSGVSKTVSLKLEPGAALSTVSFNPTTITGSKNSTGTVTLTAPAPSRGASISLASSNTTVVTLPASVSVVAGATTATFTAVSKTVKTATTVTISAGYRDVTKTASLTVIPVALSSLVLNPASVTGVGVTSTATVSLTAPAPAGGSTVTLSSSNTGAATVPASVLIAAGATSASFHVTSKSVSATTSVTISSSWNGTTKTDKLTVNPGSAALASLTLNPAIMIVKAKSSATVSLTAPAPAGGAVITIANDNTLYTNTPGTVTIPAGAISANFPVLGTAFSSAGTVHVSASYKGVTKTAALTLVNTRVAGLTLAPATVTGENNTTATITLNGISPDPTTVVVTSSAPQAVTFPGLVTVPGGSKTASFTVKTAMVGAAKQVTFTAEANDNVTASATLTINLTTRGKRGVLNNVVFKDGGTASGYFTYDAATNTYLNVNITVTNGDPHSPLGLAPESKYFYPTTGENVLSTFFGSETTNAALWLQNPVVSNLDHPDVNNWTMLVLAFAKPLTNTAGTISLVVNPNVQYTPFCNGGLIPCVIPPANISQEYFAQPFSNPTFYYRTVVSGSIVSQ
ncbi:MAG TPA: SBBP repeat-containing protein [Bryobacteraceae bacterium]|jgi:hypothetical protein|nr:SBBP repeat-containing protein [Bryobacteraceae bacterium]